MHCDNWCDHSGIGEVGIDETSRRKGHDYITVGVYQRNYSKVLLVIVNRDPTALVHGDEAAHSAAEASRLLFGDLDPVQAKPETWKLLARELPTASLPDDITVETSVLDVVAASTLVKSRSDARRQLSQGGISVNGRRVTESSGVGEPLAGGFYLVQRGKKANFLFTP